MMATLERMLWPIRRRVLNMIARAAVVLVDDAGETQLVQLQAPRGETHDGVEHLQPYGFSVHPYPGAEPVLLCVGGMRQHPVAIIATDKRRRPTGLSAGDVCVYGDSDSDTDGQHRLILKAGGTAELICGASSIVMSDTKITITAATVDVVGSQGTWRTP